jgi:hypothetical protein
MTAVLKPGDGVISAPGEVDYFTLNLQANVKYTAWAFGQTMKGGTLPNPEIAVVDAQGHVYAHVDDTLAFGRDPYATFSVPANGTYFLLVYDHAGSVGSYHPGIDVYHGPVSFGSTPGSFGVGS